MIDVREDDLTPEQRDAADDAALDRILDGEGEGSGPAAPAVPAPDGATPAHVDEEDAPARNAESDADDDGKPATLDDELVRALRRDGVPQAVIDATDADTLRVWAKAAAKRQADVDAAFRDRKSDADARGEDDGGDPSADDATPEAGREGDPPSADGSDAATDAADRFAALFGEDAAEPVRAMAAELNALRAQLATTTQAAATEQQQAQVAWAVAELAVQRPGLTAQQVQQVLGTAQQLAAAKPGAFSTYSEMLQAAANTVLGVAPSQRGGPTPPKATVREKPLTPDEIDDRVLDGILAGMSAEDARKAVGV